MGRRVVITGLGVISPVGIGKDTYWNSLTEGKSGIDQITHFDATDFSCTIAGEVKDFNIEDFSDVIERKEARRMDRFQHLAVAAAKLALLDAKLTIDDDNDSVIGVVVGSGIGGLSSMEDGYDTLKEKGPRRISPFLIPMMITDLAAGHISIIFGAKGPNLCTVSACASGSHAIGEAFETIKRGNADCMITGGAEAPITPLGVGAFCAARALSTRNDEPQRASRPFDMNRDGFVMGEGSGIIILEELGFAKKRGANIYAELIGYGASADAYHITQPDPTGAGAIKSMQAALDEAGIDLTDVDYINAHGTSTEVGDIAETTAIKSLFGEHAYKLLVSSTKSVTGHLLGAAGAIEIIASTLAIDSGIVPPTMNLDEPDPECDLNYAPNKAVKQTTNIVLSNSFGFGGHNASLLVKRFEE